MITTAEWLADELKPRTRPEIAARNAAIFASSSAKPYVMPASKPVEVKVKRVKAVGSLVIHIAPQLGEALNPPALCSTKRGRACKDPTAVCLVVDRFCSRCWNRWAKLQAR